MPPSQISALVVTANGGIEVLEVQDRELAEPGPDELQVRIGAGGINFADVYRREGIYPSPVPYVSGNEGAGEVIAVGSGVVGVAVGDTVAWATGGGSHATVTNVKAADAVPVPGEVGVDLAAAAMLQGMTAHYLVNSTYNVQPGDSVLVHAAAGGVGQLLVQLAIGRGAHVIATVGSAAKRDKVLALGAHTVLRYDEISGERELSSAVREANGGEGVSVVYDGVGRATFDASLRSLAPRGLLALFGGSSGQVPPFDLQRLNSAGSLFVTRPTLPHHLRTRDELLWRSGSILGALADGSLQLEIGGRYPLTEARAAYAALEGRATTGKLLLIP